MGKLNNRQQGFGAVETILIIVIVALLGLVGWYVYDKNRNPQTDTAATQQNTQTTSSTDNTQKPDEPKTDANTFKVAELGIKILNVPAELSDMNYAVNVNGTQDGFTYAYFSTETLSKMDNACSPTGHVSNNGSLAKNTGTYSEAEAQQVGSPDQFVKQFDGYWISYNHPQAACSSDEKAVALHVSQTKIFMDLVTNPENIAEIK